MKNNKVEFIDLGSCTVVVSIDKTTGNSDYKGDLYQVPNGQWMLQNQHAYRVYEGTRKAVEQAIVEDLVDVEVEENE